MKVLILIILIFLMVVGCMDIVGMELGREKIAREYPECANLAPGDALNCKQAVDAREGKEIKEKPNLGVGIQPVR
jgi:hypothetical protein